MSTPAANIVLTNNSTQNLTLGGIQVPGNGGQQSYNAEQIGPLCLDLTFRAAYLASVISIEVNGFGLNPATAQTTDLLDLIGAGTIG